MARMTSREIAARQRVLEQQMAVVAKAIEFLTRGLHDDAADEIAKIL